MSQAFDLGVIAVPMNQKGVQARVGGRYMMSQLHELCAVGNEIAQSDSVFPISHLVYYGLDQNNPAYQMVTQMIFPLTLQSLPEGVKKEEWIRRMGEGSFNTAEFTAAMLPELTPEVRQNIGREMYKLGLELFNAIDNKEIELVNID